MSSFYYYIMKIEEYASNVFLAENKKHYIKLVVPVTYCSCCGEWMLTFRSYYYSKFDSMFPAWYKANLRAQLERGDIKIPSNVKDKNDKIICEECAKAGLATFICALCDGERSSELEKESFGIDPLEYLCEICYGSVTAKVWSEKKKELYDEHRYDFE